MVKGKRDFAYQRNVRALEKCNFRDKDMGRLGGRVLMSYIKSRSTGLVMSDPNILVPKKA